MTLYAQNHHPAAAALCVLARKLTDSQMPLDISTMF